jgi:hypothetical protein
MADFSAIRSHFESKNLHYFVFDPESQKPVKAVIQHLPISISIEDISVGLVNLGFDIVSVKQISTTSRSPAEETATLNSCTPSFLITLPRTSKPQEIFKPTSPCHIAISVESYKA